jgi:predicted DNA-binding transcriptional regulator AlpA
MSGPSDMPSLDALAADPSKAMLLSPASARTLLCSLAGVLPILIAQANKETEKAASIPSDSLIDKEEVTSLIGMSISWVEKHPDSLPPRRSVEGNPRWLKSEVLAWVKNRPIYGQPT